MKDLLEQIWTQLHSYAREEIQAAIPLLVKILTRAGRLLGIDGILRHYKWREVAMAALLGHTAHPKTSTGGGGDATNKEGRLVEYKTEKMSITQFEKQLRRGRLKFSMVYNGAYDDGRIAPYADLEHYFGLFDEETEECLLIYRADNAYVIDTLTANNRKRVAGATTNLNTVKFDIEAADPSIVYWSPYAEEIKNRVNSSDAS